MINTGYHVYPAEVEEAIMLVPGIAGALVSGDTGDAGRVTLTAAIVLAGGAQQQDVITRITTALAGRLAPYKIPRTFRIVERLV
jgi:acyl-coenzyme A synthetase/AMP-(fatty) acid ligase